jgi:hypothetical protein
MYRFPLSTKVCLAAVGSRLQAPHSARTPSNARRQDKERLEMFEARGIEREKSKDPSDNGGSRRADLSRLERNVWSILQIGLTKEGSMMSPGKEISCGV